MHATTVRIAEGRIVHATQEMEEDGGCWACYYYYYREYRKAKIESQGKGKWWVVRCLVLQSDYHCGNSVE